jgi:hypothetical protein
MADWWTRSGTTSTAEGANGPILSSFGSVTSEKVSAKLLTRTVTAVIGSTSGAVLGSTGAVLWVAPTAVTLTAIKVAPHLGWVVATSGEVLTLWACAAGVIAEQHACSTGLFGVSGVITPLNLNASAMDLGAGEAVRFKLAIPGTTACGKPSHVQIDYVTTG